MYLTTAPLHYTSRRHPPREGACLLFTNASSLPVPRSHPASPYPFFFSHSFPPLLCPATCCHYVSVLRAVPVFLSFTLSRLFLSLSVCLSVCLPT